MNSFVPFLFEKLTIFRSCFTLDPEQLFHIAYNNYMLNKLNAFLFQ